MKLPRRKSIANVLETRQKSARRISMSADMHTRYLRQFQKEHNLQPEDSQRYNELDNEPEVNTQFGECLTCDHVKAILWLCLLCTELDQSWQDDEVIFRSNATVNEDHNNNDNDEEENGNGDFDVRTMSTNFAQNVIHDALATFGYQNVDETPRQAKRSSSSDNEEGNTSSSTATLVPSDQQFITRL